MLSDHELTRYQAHLILPDIGVAGQLALKKSKVLCVGAGGLGCPLLMSLVGAGIGEIGIIDHDIVSLSNLQRQILYVADDVGKSKVDCAKERLVALNPEVTFAIYPERLSHKNAKDLLRQYDLIADCSDNFETKLLINDYCHELKKIFVTASADQYKGYFILLDPSSGPCYRCIFEDLDTAGCDSCSSNGVFSPVLSFLSAMQASAVISFLTETGSHFNQLIEYQAKKLEQRINHITVNPDCLLKHDPVARKKIVEYPMREILSLDEMANRDYVLIDVRSLAEHQIQNIGGQCIPLETLSYNLENWSRSTCLVLHCQTGKRSRLGCEILQQMGFKEVFNFAKPFPLEG